MIFPDLVPAPHPPDVAGVAVLVLTGRRDQGAGKDAEGQGQETEEEDFEMNVFHVTFVQYHVTCNIVAVCYM